MEEVALTQTLAAARNFLRNLTAALERLYSGGMTGWGKDHSEIIGIAMTSTGLTLTQIKV